MSPPANSATNIRCELFGHSLLTMKADISRRTSTIVTPSAMRNALKFNADGSRDISIQAQTLALVLNRIGFLFVFSDYDDRMPPLKSFAVFGEPVEILIASETTNGRSATMTQSSPPNGGPPPHSHQNEDETFFVLEGEYEILLNGVSHKLLPGDALHAMRGSIHTFRNVGGKVGKMLVHIVPGGLENYLEEISHFSVPEGMPQVLEISKRYGITFVS